MDDLLKSYFERPLSEAESQALTDLLAEDEGAAVRFADLARQDYEGSDLPRPDAGRRRWPWALGLALLVGGVWSAWPHEDMVVAPVAQEEGSFRVTQAAVPTPQPQARREAPVSQSEDGLQARRQGTGFVLTVAAAHGGPAALELRDRQDRLLRRLYQGRLNTGRWGFYWDQSGADGQPLQPGRYKIVLKRGSMTSAVTVFEAGER